LKQTFKNNEGSKISISDEAGRVIIFNFMKQLDHSKNALVPCNRSNKDLSNNLGNDPVASIEITQNLKENRIVTCSVERELRIWNRDGGQYIKKYDLTSFTSNQILFLKCIDEGITVSTLGKDENTVFLGSKDMNVYLIDIHKGKLCIVYEGHWSKLIEITDVDRISFIYKLLHTDVLATVSDSNIKVWDLECDECIKNVNEHTNPVIHVT
jgi:WD40 repeat protein